MKNKNNGITLALLVIIILLLLILVAIGVGAGVQIGINMVADNNESLAKANEINSGTTGETSGGTTAGGETTGTTDGGTTLTLPAGWDSTKVVDVVAEGTRKAPVPKGYVASSVTGESKISEGLVIYQGTEKVNSTNHETALTTRNQFVWIPVDDINQMVMCKSNTSTSVCNLKLQADGTLKCATHNSTDLCGRLYTKSSMYSEVDGKVVHLTSMDFRDRTQTWSSLEDREPDIAKNCDDAPSGDYCLSLAGIADKTVATFSAQLISDFKAMAESVAKYGGFYISRYEAGENGASKKNQVAITSSDSNTTVTKGVEMWHGLYGTLRSSTAVDKTAVNTHMVWRMPVGSNDKIFRRKWCK